ncbi:hypothetical protein TNIN_67511 [Trichonephila inaurata madagascariensis]|uniref:Uncharacterized protein n=1 Tax=Trichonephila inaurata madagascariensis TaxID=2747483 RepID=A0A8X6IFJ4_9ARAC|nr:hypothetical protein TNIN_67511 [Trichonephila inaurata madagascariensis]
MPRCEHALTVASCKDCLCSGDRSGDLGLLIKRFFTQECFSDLFDLYYVMCNQIHTLHVSRVKIPEFFGTYKRTLKFRLFPNRPLNIEPQSNDKDAQNWYLTFLTFSHYVRTSQLNLIHPIILYNESLTESELEHGDLNCQAVTALIMKRKT